ncbi:unnamed protein product [Brassica napus]|uniref:(rape) hypothetical protein n=1 Tax=Brassica napus TaxID=3708 RepID=A0A816JN59_BRANA|nr:unnamed protein product [Brassica napus]
MKGRKRKNPSTTHALESPVETRARKAVSAGMSRKRNACSFSLSLIRKVMTCPLYHLRKRRKKLRKLKIILWRVPLRNRLS